MQKSNKLSLTEDSQSPSWRRPIRIRAMYLRRSVTSEGEEKYLIETRSNLEEHLSPFVNGTVRNICERKGYITVGCMH